MVILAPDDESEIREVQILRSGAGAHRDGIFAVTLNSDILFHLEHHGVQICLGHEDVRGTAIDDYVLGAAVCVSLICYP